MRSALHTVGLAIALILLATAGCSYPEGAPSLAPQKVVSPVDSAEARQVVDRYMAALSAGDVEGAGTLLVGRAVETSRALAGASGVELLSVTEVPGGGGSDPSIHVFDVQCDVSYPANSMADQSGVYVYRMKVVSTEDGLRIESMGP